MVWTLVIYIYAGVMAKGDSVSLATVPGFTSESQCKEAGAASKPLVAGSLKEFRFVCIGVPKP